MQSPFTFRAKALTYQTKITAPSRKHCFTTRDLAKGLHRLPASVAGTETFSPLLTLLHPRAHPCSLASLQSRN